MIIEIKHLDFAENYPKNIAVPNCSRKKTTSLDFAQISFDPKTETDDQGYDFVLVSGSKFGVVDVCNLLELPANEGR